jgi:hypothetical protein
VDTTPPALTVPTAPVAAEAAVPFAFDALVHASDDVDGSLAPSCMPSSPAVFAVGSHVVECTASDAAGNTTKAPFTVVASDRTPPKLTVPAGPFTAEAATSFSFAAIVSAVDAVDGPVPVACTPASGSVVALGAHRVVCRAVDAAGNAATEAFTLVGVDTTKPVVTVPSAWKGTALTPVPSAAIPVTATDSVDGALAPTCSPARIPRGTSTITCTATDRAGNVGSASFTAVGTLPV